MNQIFYSQKWRNSYIIIFVLLFSGIGRTNAQSELLQLNLLLEDDQHLDWSEVFPVWLAQDIPAGITLGKITGENTLIGMINVNGLDEQLVLHGVISDGQYVMDEWYDNSYQTGKVILEKMEDSIRGYWFNVSGNRRFAIDPRSLVTHSQSSIYQYQSDKTIFFTADDGSKELLLDQSVMDEEVWMNRQSAGKGCYDIKIGGQILTFCRTGQIKLYGYHKVGLVHMLHGQIPQIPHDEVFNSFVSSQLKKWEAIIFKDSIEHIESDRWSENQLVWFIPDFVNDEIVSGLLSIQFSGTEIIHSLAIIYDRNQNKFYSTEDFFRNNAPWNKNFQEMAKRTLYETHQDVIDIFPEIFERVRFHLTMSANGLLISSDFTPYFGRLVCLLSDEGHKDQIQKFAPYRRMLNLR